MGYSYQDLHFQDSNFGEKPSVHDMIYVSANRGHDYPPEN